MHAGAQHTVLHFNICWLGDNRTSVGIWENKYIIDVDHRIMSLRWVARQQHSLTLHCINPLQMGSVARPLHRWHRAILANTLGYSSAEIDELVRKGIVPRPAGPVLLRLHQARLAYGEKMKNDEKI